MSYTISPETKRRLGLGLTPMPCHRNRRRRDPRALRLIITVLLIITVITAITFLKP
jgi:hypothetical protein